MNYEVVAAGFAFPEGPCVDSEGTLYVVELANRCVSKIVNSERVIVANVGGAPNGAAFGRDGYLYIANNGGRWDENPTTRGYGPADGHASIQRLSTKDGRFSTVLSDIGGIPLSSPNDIVFDDDGGFYFTDPIWRARLADGTNDPNSDVPGRVCYGTPEGNGAVLNTDFLFPNGIQISPDRKLLVVAESRTGNLHGFPIIAPGQVGKSFLYASLGKEVSPDGMCFDLDGRLIVADHGSGALYVVAKNGVNIERTIQLDDPEITNLCFGGPDFETIFVTEASLGRVVSIQWDTPGLSLLDN